MRLFSQKDIIELTGIDPGEGFWLIDLHAVLNLLIDIELGL